MSNMDKEIDKQDSRGYNHVRGYTEKDKAMEQEREEAIAELADQYFDEGIDLIDLVSEYNDYPVFTSTIRALYIARKRGDDKSVVVFCSVLTRMIDDALWTKAELEAHK